MERTSASDAKPRNVQKTRKKACDLLLPIRPSNLSRRQLLSLPPDESFAFGGTHTTVEPVFSATR
jgi:hypothetical protein